jgi:hypothetical protein
VLKRLTCAKRSFINLHILKVSMSVTILELRALLFRRKTKLKVDLGELRNEGNNLSSFLHSNLKVDVTPKGNELLVNSDELSSQALKRTVRKFVYHQNLNNTYWVTLKSGVVKINKFEVAKKHKKHKKEGPPPSIIKHGW